jgi:hypothetical protein
MYTGTAYSGWLIIATRKRTTSVWQGRHGGHSWAFCVLWKNGQEETCSLSTTAVGGQVFGWECTMCDGHGWMNKRHGVVKE